MKFKAKEKKTPTLGDMRFIRGFLLFPIKLDDEWRWLETTKWVEQYSVGDCTDGSYFYWKKIYWMENFRR